MSVIKHHPFRENKHVACLQLNRPEVLNALSTQLMEELLENLFALEKDPLVRAIIITGNTKAFAAGADIAEMGEAGAIDHFLDQRFLSWQQLPLISKPLIAAINGFCLGGGLELAMNCDLLIAGDSATLGQPEIKIGTTPGAGGTQRLTRAIGKARAMKLILTGESINAREAYEWGLLSSVVPDDLVLEEAYQLANTISERSPIAVRLAKDSVLKASEMSLKEALEFERRNFYLTFASNDQKEGMKAFLEKRTPHYQGR